MISKKIHLLNSLLICNLLFSSIALASIDFDLYLHFDKEKFADPMAKVYKHYFPVEDRKIESYDQTTNLYWIINGAPKGGNKPLVKPEIIKISDLRARIMDYLEEEYPYLYPNKLKLIAEKETPAGRIQLADDYVIQQTKTIFVPEGSPIPPLGQGATITKRQPVTVTWENNKTEEVWPPGGKGSDIYEPAADNKKIHIIVTTTY